MATSKKTILVTGGAGYLGSVLVPLLLKEGHNVRVLDKGYFGADSLSSVKNRIAFQFGDVRSFDESLLDGVEAIVHLAGFSNDPTANYNPKANESINVDGTKNLIRLAKARGIRHFLFASSCSVYQSENPEEGIKTEDSPAAPTSPYAISKVHAEQELLAAADNNFIPIIFRTATLYGVSPRMRYDLAINTFTKDAFTKGKLTIHLRGKTWRPFLHLRNAAAAYLFFLSQPDMLKEPHTLNILEDNILIHTLAYRVKKILETSFGVSPTIELQDVVGAPRRSFEVSNAKMKAIGLSFPFLLEDGVKEIWEYLQANPDIDNPIFYNIRWLETLVDMQERFRYLKDVF